MRQQTELTFIIGSEKLDNEYKKEVIALASKLCGGCTVVNSTGYWTDDVTPYSDIFYGKLETEDCLTIKLTTENAKLDFVYNEMQKGIAIITKRHQQNVQWVHVQETAINGRHFNVDNVLIEQSVVA